ncbi:MAG: hypothetical protein ABI617_05545 [Sphingomicrobium sp.]
MREMTRLLLAAAVSIAIPASAQVAPVPATGPASPEAVGEKVVEGATAQRVDQVERCPGHKFDSVVEIDPVRKRSTRVKLCADPGASDADWVKTLEAAVVQIEQRAMPDEAKDKLIGELKGEIAKFASAAPSASPSATTSQSATAFVGNLGGIGAVADPSERYETSIVPPLPPPLPRRTASSATATAGSTAVVSAPVPAMRFRIKCLSRGESGGGSTCDFFDSGTVLALSAVEGLDQGGTLRFRRKGAVRGEVTLAPLPTGKSVRVRLPSDLCRGVSFTRIELELLPPGSTGTVAGRAGPYEMRC